MKKLLNLALVALLPMLMGCPATTSDPGMEPPRVSEYSPIWMSRTQLENSIDFKQPRNINNPGKIFVNGHYLYINELYKGVHIIDNRDPKNPVKLGFIQVPGNVDMALKGHMLYVDNAVDLVAIDLSDAANPQVTERIRNSFPELTPPDGAQITFDRKDAPKDAVLVGWEKKTKVQ